MSQPISAAVLIGVSDYSTYDASAGRPVGTSNLFSPRNNLQLAWEMCRELGFNASSMALLSAPLSGLIDAHPGIYGEATRQQVLDAVAAMARQLASGDIARGYIHFSGHGGSLPGVGPIMAVADTTAEGGKLVGYVSLSEIGEILVAKAPGKPVTIVLDSCGSGLIPRDFSHGRQAALRDIAAVRDRDVLLSSTAPGQVGAEVEIGGTWYGALSWALARASYQYRRRIEHNTVMYDTSADNLLERASQLIAGSSLPQTPQLAGGGGAMFLQPSGIPPVKPTYTLRDGGHGGLEVNAGESGLTGNEDNFVVFDVLINSTVVGTMTTAYNTTTHTAYRDYWSVDPSSLDGTLGNTLTFRYSHTGGAFPGYTNQHNMRAFKTSAHGSDFITYSIGANATIWCLHNVHNGKREAYFITYPSGHTKWLVESRGYTGALSLLSNLPSPSSQGGYMLNGTTELVMTSVTDSNNSLGSVLPAYKVSDYS